MDNTSKTTAKDFFLYLGIMIALYVSIISFFVLIYQIIDTAFPLAGAYESGSAYMIRSGIAALIIFFPAFFYLGYLASIDLVANPEKKDIWVRRWMIFSTLFVAGLTIAIDLATLIYRFLGAEDLTLQFSIKVIVVLLVAARVFRSSLHNLQRKSFAYDRSDKTWMSIASVIILASIIYGVVIIGTPGEQRAQMFDAQRINDLSSIQNQIVYTQWENLGSVPTSTSALNDPISGFIVPKDPQTGADYGYTMLSKNSFELCATFQTLAGTSTSNANIVTPAPALYPDPTLDENWQHGAGMVCFTRTIRSEFI